MYVGRKTERAVAIVIGSVTMAASPQPSPIVSAHLSATISATDFVHGPGPAIINTPVSRYERDDIDS